MISSSKSSTIHAIAVPLMTSTCTMNTPPATSMTWAATVMLCNGAHSRLNRTWSGSATTLVIDNLVSLKEPSMPQVKATSTSTVPRLSTPMTPTAPCTPKTTY
ncbi:hypothetical protein GQ42DRAFT_17278 [Ramicandelaber brevisporus]|nr:hypothetical protein GQ42DRAFT_17278 [Ramicandelaber brevisporus]